MPVKKVRTFKIFFIIFFSLAGLLLLFELFFYLQCYSYVNKLPQDKGQLLRIMLYGSSENPEGQTVSAKISILNRNGREIACVERSWPKPYLAVDFRYSAFMGNNYYFPEKIYGTSSVSVSRSILERNSSSYLERYYINNHHCLLGTDDFQQKVLYRFFTFAVNKNTVNLSDCETGKYYGVFAEKGRLIVRAE